MALRMRRGATVEWIRCRIYLACLRAPYAGTIGRI